MAGHTEKQDGHGAGGRKRSFLLPAVYAASEACMLIALKCLEFAGGHARACTGLMYGSIVLNTIVTVLSLIAFCKTRRASGKEGAGLFRTGGVPDAGFTACALLFTLAADTVLTLLDRWYLIGVLLFCIVQTLYAFAMKPSGKVLLVRLTVFLAVTAALVPMGMADALNIASAYSITQLSINVVLSFALLRKARPEEKRGDFLFALGLALFWGCDTSVGVFNLSRGVPGLETVYAVSAFLMWFFYMPAQVLLVFSER